MTKGLTRAALAWLLACTAAFAQDASSPAPRNSIKLLRVIAALPAGAPWLTLRTGHNALVPLCIYDGVTRTWTGGREPQSLPLYAAAFKTELERAGYKVITPGEDNLFDASADAADYEAAAVITDEKIDGCISEGTFYTSKGDIRGDSAMTVDWQIYSPVRKQVVARISTSSAVKIEKSVPGGVARLISESFSGNARELASNAEFRAAVTSSKPLASNEIVSPAKQDKITLAGSLKSGKRPIADAVGAVVTVYSSLGTGSGDLVSADGYMLTNAHVVGSDKSVRVRWSDGIETVAEVVRVAKDRDVALIKTSSRDRDPLPIKRGPVSPGQRVYAIGSPKGQDFQGTVSSGVVSASRVFEGMRYIQSDVAISHGSSGGALLDENGAMLGIAVSGIDTSIATGLNFFIPIGDAMDFLDLEQH